MKAIIADNLTKMFGQLVAVDHISFEQVLTSSLGWKLIEEAGKPIELMLIWMSMTITVGLSGDTLSSAESGAGGNYEMLKSVAFSLPCRLYIAPIIRSGDVEYQAYHWVHHS